MAMIFEALNPGITVLALLAVTLICCTISYWLSRRNIESELKKVQSRLTEIGELKSAVKALSQKKEETPPPPKPAQVSERPAPKPVPAPVPDELPHEALVVIAAAVAAFLGKSVRLRSARLIQPMGESQWAQQGRVYVQASHNLSLAQRAH